jgi:1-acyl-sn-glycerol-3-phosphate acyltransferase
MALRLRIPIVAIYLDGLFKVYSVHHDWPQPGKVRVRIGSPLKFGQGNYQAAARQIEKALHSLIDKEV